MPAVAPVVICEGRSTFNFVYVIPDIVLADISQISHLRLSGRSRELVQLEVRVSLYFEAG